MKGNYITYEEQIRQVLESLNKETAIESTRFSFAVPEHYFHDFTERLHRHPLIAPGNRNEAPPHYFETLPGKLADRILPSGKHVGVEVPDRYFEQLPLRIQDRLYKESEKRKTLVTPTLKPVLAFAGLLLLFTSTFLIYRSTENQHLKKDEVAQTTPKVREVREINPTEVADIDETVLVEVLQEDKKSQDLVKTNRQQFKETITDYLLENQIDEHSITDEI